MEIDGLFGGLPAHPLLVHGAVVLVPLAAVAFIATCWREPWRKAYLLPITLVGLAGGFFAFLARETGESLTESLRSAGKSVTVGEHPENGDTAFFFAMLLALAFVAVYVFYRYGPQLRERLGIRTMPRLPVSYETALYVATVPFAVLALVTMIVAGHSGAQLVWKTNAP
ncbi:MAG TPA: DUF2231 domain-containing protein [Dehalococcoidia bacterium]|jgi:p-aminobenzoyl-glutamate transporter AbgT|nr:DUF2231 domain-containing protein [Dehalococcoidia bacterium]